MSSQLVKETATFRRELPNLLSKEGHFALVVGDEVIGTFESYSDAIQAGYSKVGLKPFLVKKITQIEESASFTRDFTLCLS